MTSELWRRAIAYHEAGHAVIALHEGIAVKSISMIPDQRSAGRVEHHSPIVGHEIEFDTGAHSQRRAEAAIRVLMAGRIAQRLFHARSYRSYHARSDHEHALVILSNLAGPETEQRIYWRLLDIQTRELLQQDINWNRVQTLSEALLSYGTLSSDQIEDIVGTFSESERIVACIGEEQGAELLELLNHVEQAGYFRLSLNLRALRGQLAMRERSKDINT